MNIFKKLIKKIVGEKKIEPSLTEFEKRFKAKLELVQYILKSNKQRFNNSRINDAVEGFVFDAKNDNQFKSYGSNIRKYIQYLQQLNRIGLVSFSDGDFDSKSEKIIEELDRAKEKSARSQEIQKEYLQEIISKYRFAIKDIIEKDYPFIDKDSFLNFASKVEESLKKMEASIKKYKSDEFVRGEDFDVFLVHFSQITKTFDALSEAIKGLFQQIKYEDKFVDEYFRLINKVFKIKEEVKDRENLESLKGLYRQLNEANSTAYKTYFRKVRNYRFDVQNIADNIGDLFDKTEIKTQMPIIDFNAEQMFYEVFKQLVKNEDFNQILQTNKVEGFDQLSDIAKLTFEAIEQYMKKVNMDFVFDVDYEISMKQTSSIARMEQDTHEHKVGFYEATISVYRDSLIEILEREDTGVYKVFQVISTILHECGHRLDLLNNEEKYLARRDKTIYSDLRNKGFLSQIDEIDGVDIALLMHLSPSLAEYIQSLKNEAEQQNDDEDFKTAFSKSVKKFIEKLNLCEYYKNDVEVFARHFSAFGTATIVRALKIYYAEDFKSITTFSEEGSPALIRTANVAKLANLKELDESDISLVDTGNKGYIIDFEEGDNEGIYILTEDKLSEEGEKIIEEIFVLGKKIVEDLKYAHDVSLMVKMFIQHIGVEDASKKEEMQKKAKNILQAYLKNLPEEELQKVMTQAMQMHCKPVIETILDANPSKIISAFDEQVWIQYFEYLSKYGQSSLFCDSEIKIDIEDWKKWQGGVKKTCDRNYKSPNEEYKNNYIYIIKTILGSKNFVALKSIPKAICTCSEELLIDFINQIHYENKETLEYEEFLIDLLDLDKLEKYKTLKDLARDELEKYGEIFTKLRKKKQARYDIPALKPVEDVEGLSEKEKADKFMEDLIKQYK